MPLALLDILEQDGIGEEVEKLIFANMSWFTVGMLSRVNRKMRDKCRVRLLERGEWTKQNGRKGEGWGVFKRRMKVTRLEIETGILDICVSPQMLWYMYKIEKYKPQVCAVLIYGTGRMLTHVLETDGACGEHVRACIEFGEPVNSENFQKIAEDFEWDVTCAAMGKMGAYHLDQPDIRAATSSAAARAGKIDFLENEFAKEKKKHMGSVMKAAARGCQAVVLAWGRLKKLKQYGDLGLLAVKGGAERKKPYFVIIDTLEQVESICGGFTEDALLTLFSESMVRGLLGVARYLYDRGDMISKNSMRHACMRDAVRGGSIPSVKYAMRLNHASRVSAQSIRMAARLGRVETLRYVYEVVGVDANELNTAVIMAVEDSKVYSERGPVAALYNAGFPCDWDAIMIYAAALGKIGTMKFLRSLDTAIDARAMLAAIRGNRMDAVKLACNWGVPWDPKFEKVAREVVMDKYVMELYGIQGGCAMRRV